MNKKLLILGAGRGQVGLYKAAKEMGLYTIAGTMPGDNLPGIPLADEVCYMNIADPDDVEKKAIDLDLDGVATCCLDTGIAALGRTCDRLGLIGLTENAAILCNDKSKMKEAFKKGEVATPKYYEVSTEEEFLNAVDNIMLPVIIKATDLQGSRGIHIARKKEDAVNSFRLTMGETRRSYCIVEEYVEGWDFGAQAFVYDGEILFVMLQGDETYMSNAPAPIGHYVPLQCDEAVRERAEDCCKKAIRALGLNNCAVNIDLLLKDKEVYMIELTGRAGANCLPELVQINFGIEYYKMIAAMAVGDDPLTYWEKKCENKKAGLAKMFLETERPGVLKEIKYVNIDNPDIVEVTFFKHPGDKVRVFENSNDCIGQCIVQGETLDSCKETVRKITENIEIVLD